MAGKLETSLSPKPKKPKAPAQDNQAVAVSLTPRTVSDFVLSGPSADLTRPTHTWQAICFTQLIYLNVNHLTPPPLWGGARRREDGRGTTSSQKRIMDLFTYSFLSGGLRGTLAVILLLSVCVALAQSDLGESPLPRPLPTPWPKCACACRCRTLPLTASRPQHSHS